MLVNLLTAKPLSLLNNTFLRSALVGTLSVAVASSYASIEPTPAMMAEKSPKSMLLDIQHAGDKLVAVGERGHILVSSDQGNTWSQKPSPISQLITAVNFPSAQVGYAVAHDGHVLRTDDGGETWTLVRSGLKAQGELNEIAVKELTAEVARVKALIDSGAEVDEQMPARFAGMSILEELDELEWLLESSQEKLHGNPVPSPLMDVWFKDEGTGYVVGAFGQVFKTLDNGQTWKNLRHDVSNPDGYHVNTVAGVNGGSVYLGGEAGYLAFSHDDGQTWQRAALDYDGSIFGLIASRDGETVIATGLRGNSFISQDQGLSWNKMNTVTDYSLSSGVLFGEKSIAFVGTGGTVSVSENLQDFNVTTIPSRSALSAVVAINNNQFVAVGAGGAYTFSAADDNTNNQ